MVAQLADLLLWLHRPCQACKLLIINTLPCRPRPPPWKKYPVAATFATMPCRRVKPMKKLLVLSLFPLLTAVVLAQQAPGSPTRPGFGRGGVEGPMVIRAGTLLDGQGHVLHDVQIVVENGKILRVDKNPKAAATYDLSRLTVMPGWIDVHNHVTWHFGPNGRFDDKSETPEQAALAAAANAYATLMAGFTTIQSLGSLED